MFTVPYSSTVSRNHIHITNVATGETIARTASQPFSSDNRIIHDPESAASFLRELVLQLEGGRRWFRLATIDVTLAGNPMAQHDREEAQRIFTEQGFIRVRMF